MAKYFLATIVILCLLPMIASAAAGDVIFLEDTNVVLTGFPLTLIVKAGSQVDAMTVNTDNISFDLINGSTVTIYSMDRRTLTAAPAIATGVCAAGFSYIALTSTTTQAGVTVTPGAVCAAAPPSGGAPPAAPPVVPPAAPPTVPGAGTVTPAAGGTVSATTTEGGGATVTVPPNAVAADTTITVTPIGTAESLVGSPPAGSFMVGGYVYNLSAASAGGVAVTTFSAAVTLTFTYTDAQIVGLSESTLTVYRWDVSTSQWVALPSTVNTATNTITATTTQFSKFALMGQKVVEGVPVVTVAQIKAQIIEIIQQLIVLITQLIATYQAQLAELLAATP